MLTLILASQSPRRRELLEKAGFDFHTHSMEISEILNENLSLDDALMDLARRKSDALLDSNKLLNYQEFLILSADTVVVLDGEVIGKPENLEDAKEKLRRLSGRTHTVKTAICLSKVSHPKDNVQKSVTALENAKVTFKKFSEDEITDYVERCRPLDKAGAYGVQDVPSDFIQKVDGHIDNVMGLPIELVKQKLEENGWNVRRRI